MLKTLAINNYRSILQLSAPLGELNVITGPNGSGKSNLYRALLLLAETARGGVVNALAREGGLQSTYWAGPETITSRMKRGEVPIQGGPLKEAKRLRLGFATAQYSYAIALGLPVPSSQTYFNLDPEIKQETIWAAERYRPAASLVERKGPVFRMRDGRSWRAITRHLTSFDSLFDQMADPSQAPEVLQVREFIRSWRFYDHFRTDSHAPARQPQLGTRTPVLHQDGRDLAAALQTIREIGDAAALDRAISDAFPGASIHISVQEDGRFVLEFYQHGLLRPLLASELSDGTLRYILWIAALLTPRPPSMMVLNEPETSLHPDLLPALARLIIQASAKTQVWVVSHAARLVAALNQASNCHSLELEKTFGETCIVGQQMLDAPPWQWPDK